MTQIVAPVLLGFALIALGLTPGLLARFKQGLLQFRSALLGTRPEVAYDTQSEHLPGQFWLAAGGGVLLLVLAAYLTGK